jgi:hypothetical protein
MYCEITTVIIGCSFKFILKVSVEESIMSETTNNAKSEVRFKQLIRNPWCVHNRLFNAYFEDKLLIISIVFLARLKLQEQFRCPRLSPLSLCFGGRACNFFCRLLHRVWNVISCACSRCMYRFNRFAKFSMNSSMPAALPSRFFQSKRKMARRQHRERTKQLLFGRSRPTNNYCLGWGRRGRCRMRRLIIRLFS